MARLLGADPITKTRTLFHWNAADESFHVETLQDVEAIAEVNKAAFNATDERAGWKGEWHHAAKIPMNVLMDLQRRGILGDEKAFKAWLNDSDNRLWRTRPGTI